MLLLRLFHRWSREVVLSTPGSIRCLIGPVAIGTLPFEAVFDFVTRFLAVGALDSGLLRHVDMFVFAVGISTGASGGR